MTGRVGAETDLQQARLAAQICMMRALALVQRELGTLDKVRTVLRITVYVQCAEDFTQHSEVADGASHLLSRIWAMQERTPAHRWGCISCPKMHPLNWIWWFLSVQSWLHTLICLLTFDEISCLKLR